MATGGEDDSGGNDDEESERQRSPSPLMSTNSAEQQLVYYPFYEQDLSLDQDGSQSNISKIQNYADIDVRAQLPILSMQMETLICMIRDKYAWLNQKLWNS